MKLSELPWSEATYEGVRYAKTDFFTVYEHLYRVGSKGPLYNIYERGRWVGARSALGHWVWLDALSAQCVLLALLNGDTYPEGNDLGDTTP